jgi:Tol biopolymer transport system component
MSPAHRPRWLVPVAVLVLDAVLLFGAVGVGLAIPSLRLFGDIGKDPSLDYSALLGDLSPLREGFIAEVLGLEQPPPAANSSANVPVPGSENVATTSANSGSVAPGRPERTIVEDPELDNDHFDRAYPVETVPFTARTEASQISREPGEPGASCLPEGETVWFRYRPDRDVGLIANSFGTPTPVALAVFTGESFGELTELDCDFNEAGNAQVVFPGKEGTQYHFQVTTAGAGHLEFSLDPLGRTELVSVSSDGTGSADGHALSASVSANGRFVAFASSGYNLVEEDTNKGWIGGFSDVFVRDLKTGRTERVSVSSQGEQTNTQAGDSGFPSISGSGRYVAFVSAAPNLIPDDHNDATDVFVHDRKTGRTERVSISSSGDEGRLSASWQTACSLNDDTMLKDVLVNPTSGGWGEICWLNDHYFSHGVSITADGRYVAFSSNLHGLVPGVRECTDTGGFELSATAIHPHLPTAGVPGVDAGWLSCRQIYIHDRKTGETSLASISSGGEAGNADSSSPFIASGGRWVTFASGASNLAPVVAENGTTAPDSNGTRDAFVHDLRTGTTELVSVSTDEQQGLGDSGGYSHRGHVTISDDGRWVAFISSAPNLAPGDANTETDVFLRDRRKGQTSLLSPGPGESGHATISGDGRYVALTYPREPGEILPGVPQATGHLAEVIVYDRRTRTVTRVSVATSGRESGGSAHEPEISADGRFVVFQGMGMELDDRGRDRDPEEDWDVYIHELPWTR